MLRRRSAVLGIPDLRLQDYCKKMLEKIQAHTGRPWKLEINFEEWAAAIDVRFPSVFLQHEVVALTLHFSPEVPSDPRAVVESLSVSLSLPQ